MLLGYNGPIADGEKILAPARQFGKPLADLVGPVPYGAPAHAGRGQRGARPAPLLAAFTEQISDALIDVLVEDAAGFSSPMSALLFFYMHGAATRVSPTATAFAARRPQWDFDAIGQWMDGAQSPQHIAWVRKLWERLEPHLQGSAYVNHLAADDRPAKVRASFGSNYARLRELKGVYDPTNLFRVNANIATSRVEDQRRSPSSVSDRRGTSSSSRCPPCSSAGLSCSGSWDRSRFDHGSCRTSPASWERSAARPWSRFAAIGRCTVRASPWSNWRTPSG